MIERVFVLRALSVLDSLRRLALQKTARISRPFVRNRNWRVLAQAALACTAALALAAHATGYLLLIGPLVFGAAHLVVEARYLLLRPRYSPTVLVLVGGMAASAAQGFGSAALGPCIVVALILLRVDESPISRRDGALLGFAALAIVSSVVAPRWTRLAILHAHNVIALAVWAAWRKRPVAISLTVVGVACVAGLSILGGAFDHATLRSPVSDRVFSLTRITDAVASNLHGPWRRRLLVSFAFYQSLHYGVWLRLLPEEARRRETPRSWRASWLALKEELGARAAITSLAVVVAIPLLALAIGAVKVRSLYVTASEFHATTELLLLALTARNTDTAT